MSSAHVLSIQAIEAFKARLTHFDAKAQEILDATEIEIRRMLNWVRERLDYWRSEVNRRRQIFEHAQAAWQRCLESQRKQDNAKRTCNEEEAAAKQARFHLEQAEAELRALEHWVCLVERQVEDYYRQARCLKAWLDSELPKANAFLERKLTALKAYNSDG